MARAQTGPRSFIEQARREQIVSAAIEVLAARGFQAASLNAIAEHIGVSKGVISYHFAGKDELLREVVAHFLAGARACMMPRIEAATSYREALRVYVTTNLGYLAAHRRQVSAFMEIMNGMAASGRDGGPYAEGYRSAVAGLAELLEGGQAAGEFGAFSAPAAAIAIRAAIDAVAPQLRSDPRFDIEAYGTQLLVLFEKAVRA
jgi:TetR/AcrR family fatty acid metabolism transcriptional regulator